MQHWSANYKAGNAVGLVSFACHSKQGYFQLHSTLGIRALKYNSKGGVKKRDVRFISY